MKRSFTLHSIILFCIMLGVTLHGQVSFEAIIRPKEVAVDSHFVVQFKLKLDQNHTIEDVSYPDFSDFNVVGKSNSTQRSLQGTLIIDSFTLEPLEEGNFRIGKARVTIDGKIYETDSVEITVTKGASNSAKNQQSQQQGLSKRGEILTNETSADTKLLVTTTNLSPYAGEEVSLTLQILSKDYNVLQHIRESKVNRFTNFTAVDYPSNSNTVEEENYEGTSYYSVIILQKILVPQQIGKIPLEPFQIEYPYLVKTNQRDFFGRPVNQYVWVKLNSNKLIFDVQPLPEEGKPDDFSGAVGAFNLNVFADKKEVKAGESIQMDVEISGSGDFKMVSTPSLTIPDDLEVYESNPREAVKLTLEGYKGKTSKSYTVLPQYKGDYTVPALTFSFFNPKKGQYESVSSSDLILNVTEGPERPQGESKVSESNMDDSSMIPKTEEQVFLQPIKKTFTVYTSLVSDQVLWIIIIGLLFCIVLSVFLVPYWKNRKSKRKNRTPKLSYKSALTLAKKALKQSNTLTFYSEIEKALLKFLSEEFKVDFSHYTSSKMKVFLQKHAVEKEKIEEVEALLTVCNFQKYAPSTSMESMESTYERTVNFINTFNR